MLKPLISLVVSIILFLSLIAQTRAYTLIKLTDARVNIRLFKNFSTMLAHHHQRRQRPRVHHQVRPPRRNDRRRDARLHEGRRHLRGPAPHRGQDRHVQLPEANIGRHRHLLGHEDQRHAGEGQVLPQPAHHLPREAELDNQQ